MSAIRRTSVLFQLTSSLQRWLVSGPEIAHLFSLVEFEETHDTTSNEVQEHHNSNNSAQ